MINTETLFAVTLFILILLFADKLRLTQSSHYKRLLSFSAGIAIAYVFLHLLPELGRITYLFAYRKNALLLPIPEYFVYFSGMIGFLLFYGLDHLPMIFGDKDFSEERKTHFFIHLIGFVLYSLIISYLLVHDLTETNLSIGLYSIAIGLHFFTVESNLDRQYPKLYDRFGKYILAIALVIGWGTGILIEFPKPMVIMLIGFVSGGVIMNTMLHELPKERDKCGIPFAIGALGYAALLFYF